MIRVVVEPTTLRIQWASAAALDSPATFRALTSSVVGTFSINYDAFSRRSHGKQDLRPNVLEATCEIFEAPRDLIRAREHRKVAR